MRDFDLYGLEMCRYQGEIFSSSKERTSCSSPIFLRRFMYSDVAVRLDQTDFLCEISTPADIIEEIDAEFGSSSYGKIKYDTEELYWIGYIYRYWCYTRGISSKRLYKMIKPDQLKDLYYPYHSLDPAQVIDRIMEANQMEEEDLIQRGVKLLRKLRAKA